MKNTELKRMRDRDLYSVYRQGLQECTFSSMYEAADYSRSQPAQHFYVSSTTASLLVGRILKHTSLINLHPLCRKRAWALYDLYMSYVKEHGEPECGKERIMEQIVEMPAPEFYISVRSARRAIEAERRRARRRLGL